MADAPLLTDADQVALRAFFRYHYEERVPFNRLCGLRVTRWDRDGVAIEYSLRDELTAHTNVFHGGLVATLIDSAGTGAVFADHDFNHGSRLTTVSMTVNYLSAAPGEGMVGEGRCTRRGRSTHYAEARVYGSQSRKLIAQGLLTCNTSGVRDGFDRILAAARSGVFSEADRDLGRDTGPGTKTNTNTNTNTNSRSR